MPIPSNLHLTLHLHDVYGQESKRGNGRQDHHGSWLHQLIRLVMGATLQTDRDGPILLTKVLGIIMEMAQKAPAC